jgi:predicted RNase H-like HicB family nuclease
MSHTDTTWRYAVLSTLDPDEAGFAVTVPALPGCNTESDTWDESLANACEAIKCHLRGLALDGEPLPAEQAHPELALVEV